MENEEIIRRVADTIRIERLKKKLTQQKLAELVGITLKYLNSIENRKANPSIIVVVKICLALDINLDRLIEK